MTPALLRQAAGVSGGKALEDTKIVLQTRRPRKFRPNVKSSWRRGQPGTNVADASNILVEQLGKEKVSDEDTGLLFHKSGEQFEVQEDFVHSQAKEVFYNARDIAHGLAATMPPSLFMIAACGGRVWELRGVFYYKRNKTLGSAASAKPTLLSQVRVGKVRTTIRVKSEVVDPTPISSGVRLVGLQVDPFSKLIFSNYKWCIAIPSHEGKSTLTKKHSDLFIDYDYVRVDSSAVANTLRQTLGIQVVEPSESFRPGMVSLVQTPEQCSSDAIFVCSLLLCECSLSHPHRGGGSSSIVKDSGRFSSMYRQVNMKYDDRVVYCSDHDMRDRILFTELLKVGCTKMSVKKGAAGLFS